jgi:hypothetical protein
MCTQFSTGGLSASMHFLPRTVRHPVSGEVKGSRWSRCRCIFGCTEYGTRESTCPIQLVRRHPAPVPHRIGANAMCVGQSHGINHNCIATLAARRHSQCDGRAVVSSQFEWHLTVGRTSIERRATNTANVPLFTSTPRPACNRVEFFESHRPRHDLQSCIYISDARSYAAHQHPAYMLQRKNQARSISIDTLGAGHLSRRMLQ